MPPPVTLRPLEDIVLTGERFCRLVKRHHADGLGVGWGASRFVPPPASPPSHGDFRALYAARDLDTAFAETILRDNAVGCFDRFPIPLTVLGQWDVVDVETLGLRLVDLRSHQTLAARVPTDALHAQGHGEGQKLGREIHDDPRIYAGLLFQSRLTGVENIMVFDRAIAPGLREVSRRPLLQCKAFAATIDRFVLSIV